MAKRRLEYENMLNIRKQDIFSGLRTNQDFSQSSLELVFRASANY